MKSHHDAILKGLPPHSLPFLKNCLVVHPIENVMKEERFRVVVPCCGLWFHCWDFVLANCGHIYHGWCLTTHLFTSNRCGMIECNKLMHPDWCKAFGVCYGDPKIKSSIAKLGVDVQTRQWMEEGQQSFQCDCKFPSIHICFLGSNDVRFLLSMSLCLFVHVSFQL
jgi:hypothetical protein